MTQAEFEKLEQEQLAFQAEMAIMEAEDARLEAEILENEKEIARLEESLEGCDDGYEYDPDWNLDGDSHFAVFGNEFDRC